MSAGSGASNIGYGNVSPFNNSSLVNGTNSNYSGSFSSNEIPGCPGLVGVKNNVDAAAGKYSFKGGAKIPLFPLKSNYSLNFFPICMVNLCLYCPQRFQHADHLRVKIPNPRKLHRLHSPFYRIALMKLNDQSCLNP